MDHNQIANLVEYVLRVAGSQASATGGEVGNEKIVVYLDTLPTDSEMMQAAGDLAKVLNTKVTAVENELHNGAFHIYKQQG